MEHTEGNAPTAGKVRLSGAERRVLRDLAAQHELTPAKFAARRMESTRRDFLDAVEALRRANWITVDTVPEITPAGLLALRGAQ